MPASDKIASSAALSSAGCGALCGLPNNKITRLYIWCLTAAPKQRLDIASIVSLVDRRVDILFDLTMCPEILIDEFFGIGKIHASRSR